MANPSRTGASLLIRTWIVGVIITLVVFALGQKGYFPSLSQALLWPGLLLASVFGYGAHDLPLYLLTLLFDSLIYGALLYGLAQLIRTAHS